MPWLISYKGIQRVGGRAGTSWSLAAPLEQQGGEHLLHTADLSGLIGVHIGSELEDGFFLSRAAHAEELAHHGDGALVVPDHKREEQAVEFGASRAVQLPQLLGGQHPGHHDRVIHAWHRPARGVHVWNRLVPVPQPALHEDDLVTLADNDALAEGAHGPIRAMRGRPPGDQHGLRMVVDHAGHELRVRRGITGATAIDPGLCRRGGGVAPVAGRKLPGEGPWVAVAHAAAMAATTPTTSVWGNGLFIRLVSF